MAFLSPEEQLLRLRRGCAEIISEEDLLAKLRLGRPLRVKLGLDPSAPDLHLGTAIVLRKMRQFQDLGHEAIIVIGDFTAMIGDPTGKKQSRPMLSPDEVASNAQTYREQYGLILDPERTRVTFNSQWLGALSFADVIRLTSRATVARILERDDFTTRLRDGVPIHMHELLYPICQAYDSVALEADVELGGTDQKFNNLMGRDLQREVGQPPQVVVLTPLLPGLDGVEKMSKSLGNAIGITEPPAEMFGKAMSIPDALMPDYFEYATDVPMDEVSAIREGLRSGGVHPRDAKRRLAGAIVALWHGEEAARSAAATFERLFVGKELPDEIPEAYVPADEAREGRIRLIRLLVVTGLAESNSEARRLISQGGVSVDGGRIHDVEAVVPVRQGLVVQVGRRRFARITTA
ncbi:MAG: tyrosine--tRNA ligase [Armatimonadetes bacterium]|nr:tyrosine--tRNA ligase [Armatimonadota bacterium]